MNHEVYSTLEQFLNVLRHFCRQRLDGAAPRTNQNRLKITKQHTRVGYDKQHTNLITLSVRNISQTVAPYRLSGSSRYLQEKSLLPHDQFCYQFQIGLERSFSVLPLSPTPPPPPPPTHKYTSKTLLIKTTPLPPHSHGQVKIKNSIQYMQQRVQNSI